jgi:hypothetical protein
MLITVVFTMHGTPYPDWLGGVPQAHNLSPAIEHQSWPLALSQSFDVDPVLLSPSWVLISVAEHRVTSQNSYFRL